MSFQVPIEACTGGEYVRPYFTLALRWIAWRWLDELDPAGEVVLTEEKIGQADDAIAFYMDTLQELSGGALHLVLEEDGDIDTVKWCVEEERKEDEPDEAGIALGELLLRGGQPLLDALRKLWDERMAEHRKRVGR